jgi:hypothetical protein
MAEPEADRRDVDEALCGLVVACGDTAGVLELVEASLDEFVKPVEGSVLGHAQLAGLAHRDHRHNVAGLHGFANIVRVRAWIRQQDSGFGQAIVHDQIEAQIVECLPRRDVRPHGKARTIDPEVGLGRGATSKAAETLSLSPPFAPAA